METTHWSFTLSMSRCQRVVFLYGLRLDDGEEEVAQQHQSANR